MDEFIAKFRVDWRVACFSADIYEATMTRSREDRDEDILAAPFHRGHSRPQMWAHYADNHAGACLIFRRDRLEQAMYRKASNINGRVYSRRIIYRPGSLRQRLFGSNPLIVAMSDLEHGTRHAIERHTDRHIEELLFTKHPDWQNEHEYRWIISGNKDHNLFVDCSDSLIGLLLGPRFPVDAEKHVRHYGLENEISIARMDWINGVPQPSPTMPKLLAAS
ncbi:DUF2971 domain-containing protein [Rhizorhapis sp. SPR117]|uniref:DUF2971 domain-containing protein n=1 Tax=Rhizorhapis sp. SPR117 TaxID=2912611 RepID=UPI001F2F56F7|nr:DUF2971 domain-containing protein [Rhizorhapis sp. SPR117]